MGISTLNRTLPWQKFFLTCCQPPSLPPKTGRSRTWMKRLISDWDHTDTISTGWRTQALPAHGLLEGPLTNGRLQRSRKRCCRPHVCVPLELKYWNPTLCWNVLGRRRSLWEVIRLRWGHEGGSVSHFLVMRGYSEKAGVCKPRRGPFPELAHAGTLIWASQHPELGERNLLFKPVICISTGATQGFPGGTH